MESAQVVTHAGAGLAGLTEVGGFVVVEPSEVLSFPISYDLDSSVVRGVGDSRYEYRLQLLKQPGIDTDEVNVSVSLPEGSEVIAASPGDFAASAGAANWNGTLDRDIELVLVFETP